MQQVDIIVNQILILSMLALTGFIAGKTGYLPENSGVVLSRIVIKLTAPILIITTMASRSFTHRALKDGLFIYLYGVVFLLIAYTLAVIVCRLLKIEEFSANIYKMQSMFGNVIFLAYPLFKALYGADGLAYAVFFSLANDTLLWTLGIYLVNKHNTSQWKDNLKHLINGNTVAFSIGIVFIAVNLQYYVKNNIIVGNIYELLYKTFNPLGETTIYLSMLFIGLVLSEAKIKSLSDMIKRFPLLVLSASKLIIIPCVALFALKLLGGNLSMLAKSIIILQLAMPCGTIVTALAAQYDADYRFATESVFISTLLSAVTIPFMVYMLKFAV